MKLSPIVNWSKLLRALSNGMGQKSPKQFTFSIQVSFVNHISVDVSKLSISNNNCSFKLQKSQVIEVPMIEYKKPYLLDQSLRYVEDAMRSSNGSGDGRYTEECETWIKKQLGVKQVTMTTSCTHALELALHVIELGQEDEVILPSYTYPSTANAVLLAGGKVVFSEVEPNHLTLDPAKLEAKITSKTKAIIVVHYGGICCKMDEIMHIAKKHHLVVIEDGAQSFLSKYKGRYAGTLGDFACLSFHGTKDVVAGEGGALLFHDDRYAEKVTMFRQKGTNQASYKKGLVDFYEWKTKGSSYGPSDILMAMLLGQLELSQEIIECNKIIFENYENYFKNKKAF